MSGRFNLNDYITVDERIDRFWQQYPDGAIRTELAFTNNDGTSVAIRAAVHKRAENALPDATGFAQEDRLTGVDQYGKPVKGANTTSWWENCETSAIGRALANLGMSLSKQRPSREEMQKVERYGQRQRDPDDDLPDYVPQRPPERANVTPAIEGQGVTVKYAPQRPPERATAAPAPLREDIAERQEDEALKANLLARIRDDTASPDFRKRALHTYFNGADSVEALGVRSANVRDSGLPSDDLDRAYKWHAERLASPAMAPVVAGAAG